jgi:hypothetical protein
MADEAKGVAGEGVDERVKSLEEALSVEKAKNEVLMEQILKAENGLAEKDVEGFADVIPNEDREFWRGQFLENRENATAILSRMRGRVTPAAKAEAAAAALAPVAVPPGALPSRCTTARRRSLRWPRRARRAAQTVRRSCATVHRRSRGSTAVRSLSRSVAQNRSWEKFVSSLVH